MRTLAVLVSRKTIGSRQSAFVMIVDACPEIFALRRSVSLCERACDRKVGSSSIVVAFAVKATVMVNKCTR